MAAKAVFLILPVLWVLVAKSSRRRTLETNSSDMATKVVFFVPPELWALVAESSRHRTLACLCAFSHQFYAVFTLLLYGMAMYDTPLSGEQATCLIEMLRTTRRKHPAMFVQYLDFPHMGWTARSRRKRALPPRLPLQCAQRRSACARVSAVCAGVALVAGQHRRSQSPPHPWVLSKPDGNSDRVLAFVLVLRLIEIARRLRQMGSVMERTWGGAEKSAVDAYTSLRTTINELRFPALATLELSIDTAYFDNPTPDADFTSLLRAHHA
ncbi:hypothetical protein B0H17DRAFT_1147459 [Mycena rosella]|uniref:Uncharacterized protein n=1 Tax=Mycena rosella TaxID=1033263 RepID=A0AAD7G3R8_MYCRO|nr:hypothetical protein B0H17DRAFT_1147459 [Mycena rosella]